MAEVSPYPAIRQVPSNVYDFQSRCRVSDEDSPPYDVGATDAEPPTVTPEPGADIRRAVLDRLGWQAAGFFDALLAMEDDGIPITYQIAAHHIRVSRSVVMRMCRKLVDVGAITIDRTTGGRGKESSINCVRNCVYNYVPTDTVTQETVSETVSGPPYIPPVVNVKSHPSKNVESNGVNTPPKSPNAQRTPKPESYSEGFDAFWAAYPRRDKRKDAAAVWSRIKPDADLLARMLDAIDRQRLAEKEPQYVPMPTTWLNGERWNDQGVPPKAHTNGAHRATNGRQTDAEREAVKQEALRRLGVRPAAQPEPANVFETRGTVR